MTAAPTTEGSDARRTAPRGDQDAATRRPACPAEPGRAVRVLAPLAALVGLMVHLWGLYRDHGPPSVPWFGQADKLQHLVGFGLPCLLVLVALHVRAAARGRVPRARTVILVAALFAAHAVVSELVQGEAYTTRSGDPLDALADLVGTSLGLLAHLALGRRAAGPGARHAGQEPA